jgi:hypothetical protein
MKEDWLFERLPDFLIIGAAKSGTTSLYHYLRKHPNIFMSYPLKEPRLFTDIERVRSYFLKKQGIEIASLKDLIRDYMLQGYQGEKLFGEATAEYTVGSMSRIYEIPNKIRKIDSKLKFIYILRNPFSRIISNYLHLLNVEPTLDENINEFFVDGNEHGLLMVLTSLYYRQLEVYLQFFDKKQFKVILFEEFIVTPQRHLSELCSFLDLEDHTYHESDFLVHNASNYSKHKGNSWNSCLKFSEKNYEKLLNMFMMDIPKLESFLDRSLQLWDLSKKTWVV